MSNRDRHSDEPIDTADLRLVEALYGESPPGDADGVEGEVEGEVDADLLASFQELRSMFADLPEEEPPSALTAKLMSAAAEAVKAPEKKGLWARLLALFEPIGAHPALAAAASLVLVVTVGGVLVLTGRSEVAEPEVAAPERQAVVSRDEAANERAKSEEAAPSGTESAATGETGESTVGANARADLPPASESRPEPSPDKRTEAPGREAKDDAKRPLGGKKISPAKATRSRTNVKKGGKGKSRTGLDFSGATVDDGTDELEPDLDSKPSPKQPSPDLPTMQRPQTTKSAAEVESLTSKGRRAAAKGDCGLVMKLGTRILSIDPAHYREVYRRDTQINRCYAQQKKRPATRK